MFLPLHVGTALFGRLHRCGTTSVATLFFHVWRVPLVPLRSYLVLEEHPDGAFEAIPQPLRATSVLAGYARTGTIASWVAMVAALLLSSGASDPSLAATGLSLGVAALAASSIVVAAWILMGQVPVDERAWQLAYADVVAHPVDVALLPEERRQELRVGLQRALAEHARMRALGGTPYRDAAMDWPRIALHPDERDARVLGAALTLARVEWSLAPRERKLQFARTHAAVWTRLRVLAPWLLERAQKL
jgi:hypothetical protein